MKKFFTFFTALALLCAVGCEEQGDDNVNPNDKPNPEQPEEKPDDGSEIPDDAYITLNKEVLTFVPDGESVEVKVYSNYEWTLTNNCDWVTTSISGGEASEEGTAITLTADLTYDDREGTIIFNCGKAKKVLVVSQGLKEVIISDENNTFNLPVEGGTVDIAYQTTVECEVVIPSDAQHWISLAPETRGLESGCATLNIAESKVGADRRAVVKVVKMGDQSVFAEYTITQERNMDYIIFYTTTNGGTISPKNFDYLTNTYEDGVGMLAFDGSKVTSIGDSAFKSCTSLTSITIGNGVTSIGVYAFDACSSLTSVTIPDSVTSIGGSAFWDCDSLTSVYITDIAAWCSISFGNAYSNPLYYAGNLYLNNELVTDLIIPDGTTKIGSYAFYGYDLLTSITIPDSVTSIGDSAFYKCTSLTSITIPDGVTTIGKSAFSHCTSLTSITIPDGVTSIGNNAFNACSSLTSITIPDSVTSIGDQAFKDCTSLTSVTIPDGVTTIGYGAFWDCDSLTSVTIGNGVTSIGGYAFYGCTSLTSVTIPDSVTSIGSNAFRYCDSLTSVTIPDSVTSIGDNAFSGCTGELIVNCNIPSASSSEYGVFYDSDFTKVTIGDSVTSIGDYAFNACTSLTSVYCKPTIPPTGGFAMFSGNASGRTIYVPSDSVEAYKSAKYWKNYAASIVGYDF